MSLHESQSLRVEMQACRWAEFCVCLAPRLREAFGGEGAGWEAGNLHRLCTRAGPGLIRVDADKVTYPAHILLRYDLESATILGDIEVAYTLGAMAAAQAFRTACDSLPGTFADLAEGDFTALLGWLRDSVHSRDGVPETDELLVAATGALLGAGYFLRHPRRRLSQGRLNQAQRPLFSTIWSSFVLASCHRSPS
ncbi:Carboxypeptidase 1 [Methylobacterium marchantiae]|nr:Carboxypeptidase 1 [Methylobacterium marchantiae]